MGRSGERTAKEPRIDEGTARGLLDRLARIGCIRPVLLGAALTDTGRRPVAEIRGGERLWTARAFA